MRDAYKHTEHQALLSVIIPVYNTKETVERTLKSVLDQSWKNIEIIIVDDGSQDGAGELCDSFSCRYENVTVIHKENAGLGYARNTGLDSASGEYVAFLDSDDWVESDAYEVCIRQMQKDNSSICYYGRKVYDKNGKCSVVKTIPEVLLYSGIRVTEDYAPRYFGDYHSQIESMYIRESACCALYDRDLIEKNKIRFLSERECLSEDLFFNLDMCRYARAVSIIPMDLYNQGFNPNSLTKKRDPHRLDKIKGMYAYLLEYANKYMNISDRYQRIYYRVISYLRGYIRDEAVASNSIVYELDIARKVANDMILGRVYSSIDSSRLDRKTKIFVNWLKKKCVYSIAIFYGVKGILQSIRNK